MHFQGKFQRGHDLGRRHEIFNLDAFMFNRLNY